MKYLLVILISFTLNIESSGQVESIYYAGDFSVVRNKTQARYKRDIVRKNSSKTIVTTYELENSEWKLSYKVVFFQEKDGMITIKRPGDKLWKDKIIRSFYKDASGLYHFSDRLGKTVILEGTATSLIPLNKQDTVKSFYPGGSPRSFAVYDNNKLISNENWLRNGSSYFSNIHHFVDDLPEYSNGQTHFRMHILNGLKEAGIDLNQIAGEIVVNWVVMENGELVGFNSNSGALGELSSLLAKLIKEMPGEWIPAKIDGRPVRYYMNMPFNFIDRSENFEQLEFSTGFVVWD